ncbi:PRD domain-containing protein [Escherichia coli]|nr:PRD domain-containing protein [Escherichia coli]
MIIEKVMNNNCVQASVNGQEVIISGPGVGYNKKYGMSVPEHPANRIFYVRNEQKNKLYKLIEHVGIEYIFVAEKIVHYAESNLEKKLNPSLLLILADHISNAISRVVSGIQINNVFLEEIKALYKAEYAISRDALTIINEQFLEKDFQLQRAIHEIERYLYATFKYDLILEEKLYLSIRIKVLMD